MPVSDAGFRLPDIGHDFAGEATLAIVDDPFDQVSRHILDVGDDIHFAASIEETAIVKIGGNIHSRPAKGKHGIVEIEDVWIVLVDEVTGPTVKVLYGGGVRQGIGGVLRSIKHLRVESIPPLMLALTLRESAIVGHTGVWSLLISPMRGFEPPPVSGLVNRNAKSEPSIPRQLRPGSNYIAVWPDSFGVPWMIFRVPAIKAIMVVRESEEEASARFLIPVDQLIWLPVQKCPLRAQILVPKAGWVSVVFKVVFVLLRSFQVHVPCVPVTLFRNALRTPVRPNSKLGVLIPFRSFVLQKGVPVRIIGARTIESNEGRLHRHAIPGIGNSREFLRSIVGVRFPAGEV